MKKKEIQACLRDLISLEYGKALPDALRVSQGIYPVYGANGIKARTNEYLCDIPTLVIGRKGSVGEINISKTKFWPLDVTYYVKFDTQKLDLYYLYYLLKRQNLSILAKGVKPGLNREDVYNIPVVISPLREQKRIAGILDKVQSLIALQKQQLEKLDLLIKSKFIDMFGDLFSNSYQWPEILLKDLIIEMFIGPFGSDLKNENYVDKSEGYCVVYEQKHAIRKMLDCEFRYVNKQKFEQLKRFLVQAGDFIVSCRGTIGEIYCLPENAPRGIIHSSLMKVRPNSERVCAVYFEKILEHIINKGNKNGGVIKMAITAKELSMKTVPLPPLDLQNQFANFVKSVEQQKEVFTTRLSHLETLYKSLMQEYFG
ncbi:restriction endonuclease subunit S [Candidatus Avelusimicrobium fimicolum]|uniref:restriction endonuclease subunit S n=1 Tax=Candidatus Avelusimicrobium fimicolum TaxID=3416216 RepID=UPI003D0A8785